MENETISPIIEIEDMLQDFMFSPVKTYIIFRFSRWDHWRLQWWSYQSQNDDKVQKEDNNTKLKSELCILVNWKGWMVIPKSLRFIRYLWCFDLFCRLAEFSSVLTSLYRRLGIPNKLSTKSKSVEVNRDKKNKVEGPPTTLSLKHIFISSNFPPNNIFIWFVLEIQTRNKRKLEKWVWN